MSELAVFARLKAYLAGEAVRLGNTRNIPISGRPLVLVPIQMAGEAPALLAIGIGDLESNLTVYSCPNPTNRDHQYALLGNMARAIHQAFEGWRAGPTLMPQVICQSDAALSLILAVVDRMAYVDSGNPTTSVIRDVGRQLAFFDKRFERADSAAIISATALVTKLYATGQDPYADTHLGTVVEWLKPADGCILERVEAAERQSASISTDPVIDNTLLDPLVNSFFRAERNADRRSAASVRRRIHAVLKPEVERRYRLIQEAMAAVRTIPETPLAQMTANSDRQNFDRHVAYVTSSPGLRRGFSGDSGFVEYINRDVAHRDHQADSIHANGRERAEARISGVVLHGKVIARRERRHGRRRIIECDILTAQQRMRARAGLELQLLDNPDGFSFRVETIERQPAGVVVTLRMMVGMSKGGQPAVSDIVVLGPQKHFSQRTRHARDRLASAGTHITVAGPGSTDRDYLAIVSSLEDGQ